MRRIDLGGQTPKQCTAIDRVFRKLGDHVPKRPIFRAMGGQGHGIRTSRTILQGQRARRYQDPLEAH